MEKHHIKTIKEVEEGLENCGSLEGRNCKICSYSNYDKPICQKHLMADAMETIRFKTKQVRMLQDRLGIR